MAEISDEELAMLRAKAALVDQVKEQLDALSRKVEHLDSLRERCRGCGGDDFEEPHTCPYQKAVNDDYDFTCNCCLSCQHNCGDAI
jgi:hypothetical protein